MVAIQKQARSNIKHPIKVGSQEFNDNKLAIYEYLREEAPVYKGKVSIISAYFLSRYEDCLMVLKDPRFVRDRSTATGKGGRLPFPMPKSITALSENMIMMDGSEHRRIRNLVHKAFTPRALSQLEERIESLTHELLDKMANKGQFDLMTEYALPIPVTVISEMVGVYDEEMLEFQDALSTLSDGLTGMSMLKTFFWKLPKLRKFVSELVDRKRANPGDDVLTGLVQAEEDGEKLTQDELVAMVILLVTAGYETTVHLITNAVLTLIQHPEALQQVRDNPDLMDGAIEEILRFNGPVRGSKPLYPTEDVTFHGVTIPKGSAVMPLNGAANTDPRQFNNPDVFDITRSPNKHLGFGQGIHYCLGAPLARIETQIALTNLLERFDTIQLAVPESELELANYALCHRYKSLPVRLS